MMSRRSHTSPRERRRSTSARGRRAHSEDTTAEQGAVRRQLEAAPSEPEAPAEAEPKSEREQLEERIDDLEYFVKMLEDAGLDSAHGGALQAYAQRAEDPDAAADFQKLADDVEWGDYRAYRGKSLGTLRSALDRMRKELAALDAPKPASKRGIGAWFKRLVDRQE